eukprot:scaffold47161_cov41-Attheya_sp.AAC.3
MYYHLCLWNRKRSLVGIALVKASVLEHQNRESYIRCESRFSRESGAAKGCVVEATFPYTELFIRYYVYTSVTGWGP